MMIVSDDLVPCLTTGKIKLRPRPSHFEADHVVYDDGTKEAIDMVVLATGYQFTSGPLPKALLPVTDSNKFICYKQTFLSNPKYKSLGFVGQMFVDGPVLPVYEMQARWVARVMTGKSYTSIAIRPYWRSND